MTVNGQCGTVGVWLHVDAYGVSFYRGAYFIGEGPGMNIITDSVVAEW